jgi:hypothetical protein
MMARVSSGSRSRARAVKPSQVSKEGSDSLALALGTAAGFQGLSFGLDALGQVLRGVTSDH